MAQTPSTHASLLSRARRLSDDGAWHELEGKYRELVLRFCRARGLEVNDAEDVRQAVFVSLARHLPGFRYDPQLGRFRDYLGRMVRNAIVAHQRARARGLRTLDVTEIGVDAPAGRDASDELWDEEWSRHHLRRAMATLRKSHEPETLSVFEHLLEGASTQATALRFGLSEEAVHKIKQRVRDRLKELVAAQVDEEDRPRG